METDVDNSSALDDNGADDHLAFNPSADGLRPNSTTAPDPQPQSSERKGLRRRTSAESECSTSTYSRKRRGHTGDAATHPLRSASSSVSTSLNVAGITRPHLARIIDVDSQVGVPLVGAVDDLLDEGEVTDVLVHRVGPDDSLAGISLRYGISLANLRRANHLWASDSIHLRTALYVPVHQASRVRRVPHALVPPLQGTSTEPPSDDGPTETPFLEVIERIPASQLSFFPPSQREREPVPSSRRPASKPRPNHVRASSFSSPSLTSLLATLPIAAATRETLISRLSLDGPGSSYSDKESERSDDLELDDVKHVLHHPPGTGNTPSALISSKTSYHSPTSFEMNHYSSLRHLSRSPRSYIPPHPQIRTVQLEPSPAMHIPGRSRSFGKSETKGKTRQRSTVLDLDFELFETNV